MAQKLTNVYFRTFQSSPEESGLPGRRARTARLRTWRARGRAAEVVLACEEDTFPRDMADPGGRNGEELPTTVLPKEFLDPEAVAVSGGLRKEHLVVPGVYFTPGVKAGEAGAELGSSAESGDSVTPRYTDIAVLSRQDLIHQERELSKNVAKLKESNAEMLEFDPDGKDVDLLEAREENERSIERGEERLEMMRMRLEYLDPLDHIKGGT
jgi:hypothetical protein